ncbi:hypothetical protein [Pseudonocardia xinjiangensis]|uniref:Uncharacterized protein n=1 Tax=Pseudonocardia xinjiangensis TaxID=75289 RepID=A0ABX1RAQ5_9PSEU|nr:hypothetical protein [Pseudonocardia xinjiangensis]NMH77493.1 hypothetical protein [Pseudonocardia xinjiangensis]
MTAENPPRPTPAELIEGALARVENVRDTPSDPPGKEWHFALGVLFALTTTGQLDRQSSATVRGSHSS